MTQAIPDVFAHVKEFGSPYLGDTSALAEEEIVIRVQDLAMTSPDAAHELVIRVCEGIDDATGGQYSREIDELEELVREELGIAERL